MQFYTDTDRENNPHALPDAETFQGRDYQTDLDIVEHPGWVHTEGCELKADGWYYWFCLPGCLPDSEPSGPFDTEDLAIADAREVAS